MEILENDVLTEIRPYSFNLSETNSLTDVFWILLTEEEQTINDIYIFRQENELLISRQGAVENGRWEYIGGNSIFVRRKSQGGLLFSHCFLDKDFLILKAMGGEEMTFFINEHHFSKGVNSREKMILSIKNKYMTFSHRLEPGFNMANKSVRRIEKTEELPYQIIYENTMPFKKSYLRSEIVFSNLKSGRIVININTNIAYFKTTHPLSKKKIYYESSVACMTALHHYLSSGEILQDGLLNNHGFFRGLKGKKYGRNNAGSLVFF